MSPFPSKRKKVTLSPSMLNSLLSLPHLSLSLPRLSQVRLSPSMLVFAAEVTTPETFFQGWDNGRGSARAIKE